MGKRRIEYNPIYEPVFTTDKRYVILCGGSNAGKSYFAQQLLLSRFLQIARYNILCIRKVYDSIGGSIYHLFQKIINQWKMQDALSTIKYQIQDPRTSNMIQFGGLNDEKQRERTKSITAPNGNLEAIFIEEATQLTEDDFKELDRRMRGESDTGMPKQMFFSFNPIIESHWLRKKFQIELTRDGGYSNRDDVFVLKTTIDDNRWATSEDWAVLDQYEKDGDEYSYLVYRWGMWGVLGQDNVVIPYSLFYKARNNRVDSPKGDYKVGCDPARFGKDKCVIYFGRGDKVMEKKEFKKSDSYQMADAICDMESRHRKNKSIPIKIKIDAGEGSGVIDVVKYRKLRNCTVYEVHNGGAPKDPTKYDNVATESWFEFRDRVESIEFLHNDDEMKSQCTGRQYTFKELKGRTGTGKTVKSIEPKDHYKKRYEELHNGSPDSADAIVLWDYEPAEKPEPGIRWIS